MYWADNYLALFPGESRDIAVEYPVPPAGASPGAVQPPTLELDAWNVRSMTVARGGR